MSRRARSRDAASSQPARNVVVLWDIGATLTVPVRACRDRKACLPAHHRACRVASSSSLADLIATFVDCSQASVVARTVSTRSLATQPICQRFDTFHDRSRSTRPRSPTAQPPALSPPVSMAGSCSFKSRRQPSALSLGENYGSC